MFLVQSMDYLMYYKARFNSHSKIKFIVQIMEGNGIFVIFL